MRLIILSSVACLAEPPFFTLSKKKSRFFLGGGVTEYKIVCFDIFYTFETFLILRRIPRDIMTNYTSFHVMYLFFLSDLF